MIKLRKVDESTKHFTGRLVLSGEEGITFPSDERMFLKKLEEKILMEVKGFKYGKIMLEHFSIKIR